MELMTGFEPVTSLNWFKFISENILRESFWGSMFYNIYFLAGVQYTDF